MHLDGGVAPDGTRLLSESTVAAMQEEQIGLVDDLLGHAWGLGWILDRWGDVDVIGHDGNSIGQNAFMRVAPKERFGFCLQTNVGSALLVYRELANWLFGERFGPGSSRTRRSSPTRQSPTPAATPASTSARGCASR